jgi:TonB family protein
LGGDASDHGSGASVASVGASGGADAPPRMLFAPHAAYTEEARRLNIKGSVVLSVLLTRSGKVQVLATIKPLGHGLDESAREAAQAMEFEPARKQGKPVDYITTVRVVFDLT